jgi:hypothetical protein
MLAPQTQDKPRIIPRLSKLNRLLLATVSAPAVAQSETRHSVVIDIQMV